mmetsp:Transcript_77262/g.121609  ORF Transcript_77262/g.121609 Transcript_77262/m.121609 type:complete len:285 (-) Transcript_77262:524-1378(-)
MFLGQGGHERLDVQSTGGLIHAEFHDLLNKLIKRQPLLGLLLIFILCVGTVVLPPEKALLHLPEPLLHHAFFNSQLQQGRLDLLVGCYLAPLFLIDETILRLIHRLEGIHQAGLQFGQLSRFGFALRAIFDHLTQHTNEHVQQSHPRDHYEHHEGPHQCETLLLDLREGEDQVVHQDAVGEERHHGGTHITKELLGRWVLNACWAFIVILRNLAREHDGEDVGDDHHEKEDKDHRLHGSHHSLHQGQEFWEKTHQSCDPRETKESEEPEAAEVVQNSAAVIGAT